MTRYKLRLPSEGDVLYTDDGDGFAVAATAELARELLSEERDEAVIYVHPMVARHEIVYARHLEEAFDGAEPGDTQFWIVPGDPKHSSDVRVWGVGAPDFLWEYDYLPPESINWRKLPIGTPCYYKPEGFGKLRLPGRLWRASGKPIFPLEFENGARRELFMGQFSFHFGGPLPVPPRRVRVKVAGDLVVDGCTEGCADLMRALRVTRLRNEWEAEHFATHLAALDAEVAA